MKRLVIIKKNIGRIIFLGISIIVIIACENSQVPASNINLVPLFGDNMVLQQKQDIPVWGTADPGGVVTITFNGQRKNTIVDKNGKWKLKLDPVNAGGPFELIIAGKEAFKITNVLVGEVWVCSGQSNMDMPVGGRGKIKNYKEEIANAKYPNLRIFMVDNKIANRPQSNFNSEGWKPCSPETIPEFSAAAYFFGRRLHKDLNLPIGLIQTAWGGTMVEAWTSGAALKNIPEFTARVTKIESDTSSEEEQALAIKKRVAEWPDKIESILKEKGTFNNGFQNPEYNSDNWDSMNLPTTWEKTGLELDGVIWFKKSVNVPKSWKGNDLILSLGKINDYDITWFNGKRIGRGTDVTELRIYKIPSSLVKTGENIISVQVLDIGNSGGLYGPEKEMKLSFQDRSISLVGSWKYKIDPTKIDVKYLPEKPDQNAGVHNPGALYNAMIHPIIPYGIQGVIWYQGFSNADRSYQYRDLFKTMIRDWRNLWNQGDFYFIYGQLANIFMPEPQPYENIWSELREAQTMALDLPNTGMAVAIDIGEAKDIHPKNKQDFGKRLALIALAKVYGKDIPYSGPMYKSMKNEGNTIRLSFTNTDKGLKIKDGKELKGFAISGKDKKFVWAKAKIEGDEVIVWSSKIKNPVAVRYAWAANPICNLYNEADLPASTFRTDAWKGISYGVK